MNTDNVEEFAAKLQKRAVGCSYTENSVTSDYENGLTTKKTKLKTVLPDADIAAVLLHLLTNPMKLAIACGYKPDDETKG